MPRAYSFLLFLLLLHSTSFLSSLSLFSSEDHDLSFLYDTHCISSFSFLSLILFFLSLPSVSLSRLAFVTTSLSPCFFYTSNISSLCHSYTFSSFSTLVLRHPCAVSRPQACSPDERRIGAERILHMHVFYSIAIHSRLACCEGTDMYCP